MSDEIYRPSNMHKGKCDRIHQKHINIARTDRWSSKEMAEEVQNCYKEIDIDDKAFLTKVLQFDFIWIQSVMRIIM